MKRPVMEITSRLDIFFVCSNDPSRMKLTKKISSPFLIIALIITPVLAQQSGPPGGRPQSVAELQERVSALLDQPKFAAARWGMRIMTTDGKSVFERDADKSLMPASNMKLYTTTAALDLFGPDFKIKTSVYATSPVKKGVLRGDLIFYGRGDPNLSPRFDEDNPQPYNDLIYADKITAIEQLADQIKSDGIKIIFGDIVGDDSYFAGDLLGSGWEWDDTQFY